MLVVAVGGGALGCSRRSRPTASGQKVLRELRDRLYTHLQTLPLSFFAGARTGDLQSRVSSDVSSVQNAVTSSLSSILSNAVTFTSALVAMALLSWQLTLVMLVTIPLFVGDRAVGGRRERITREAQQNTADMTVITSETLSLSGITLAKLFGQQDREIGGCRRERPSRRHLRASAGDRPGVLHRRADLPRGDADPRVPGRGYALDGGTDLTAGTVVAFTTLQNRIFFPVARMLETFVELQSSRALFGRIFSYLDIRSDIVEADDPVDLARDEVRGVVEFDHVHFHYPDSALATITDLDVEARPGQLIAVVGPSGAGKSTVLQLVARLYDVDDGAIRIDGHDLAT